MDCSTGIKKSSFSWDWGVSGLFSFEGPIGFIKTLWTTEGDWSPATVRSLEVSGVGWINMADVSDEATFGDTALGEMGFGKRASETWVTAIRQTLWRLDEDLCLGILIIGRNWIEIVEEWNGSRRLYLGLIGGIVGVMDLTTASVSLHRLTRLGDMRGEWKWELVRTVHGKISH